MACLDVWDHVRSPFHPPKIAVDDHKNESVPRLACITLYEPHEIVEVIKLTFPGIMGT
jgi:hypothetical protein